MGGAASAASLPEDKYTVIKSDDKAGDKFNSSNPQSSGGQSLFSNNSNGNNSIIDLQKLVSQIRLFQNYHTNEIIIVVGNDVIEELQDDNEWHEVLISSKQESYFMKSNNLKTKVIIPSPTISSNGSTTESYHQDSQENVSSSFLFFPSNVSSQSKTSEKSAEKTTEKSESEVSSRYSENSHGSYVECPYCDHIFSRLDNKNQHIRECRISLEHESQNIKEWIDKISLDNSEVMSGAINEAIRLFEEKVYHRRNVILLLKKLQRKTDPRRSTSIDHIHSMLQDFHDEKENVENLIVPITSASSNYMIQRNEELGNMLKYLDKGILVLNRQISVKNKCLADFEVGNILSTGSFSTVHLARRKDNHNKLYALKVMKREFLQEQNMEFQIKRECRVMEKISRFPDIFLRHYTHVTDVEYIFILMEYVPTGDCLRLMKKMGGKLSQVLSKHIVANVILAITFLHSHGVVHRDIKPDNLLFTPLGNVKLVDFGMSTHHMNRRRGSGSQVEVSPRSDRSNNSLWLEDMFGCSVNNSNVGKSTSDDPFEKSHNTEESISSYRFSSKADNLMKTLVGNVNYAAPEVLLGEGYDQCIDWWAIGVLYFHFLAGTPPFIASTEAQTKFNVLEHKLNWSLLPSDTSNLCLSCLDGFLTKTPKLRLGAKGGEEVQKHEHFKDVDFGTILETPGPYLPPEEDIVFEPTPLSRC